MSSNPALLSCVRLLRQRHECVLNDGEGGKRRQAFIDNLTSLRLAESVLEKTEIVAALPGFPAQIAVIGPTQSGKSTLVNFLIGKTVARVSPMAGFTVHPQGFAVVENTTVLARFNDYFHDFRRVAVDDLPSQEYGFFSLEAVAQLRESLLSEAVIWDTPDFDSVSAHDYVNAVLRTVALADVVVLVVSRDKYADQSVWDTLKLIAPLQQPTVICLNKVDWDVRATLVRSLAEKWRELRRDPVPQIVTLPYASPSEAEAMAELKAQHPVLQAALDGALTTARRKDAEKIATGLVKLHWAAWTTPVRREHEALEGWSAAIERILTEALAIYRRDFLDHPQHYETFQRALAELLTLLELPGVGAVMLMARKIVTWPLRQVMRLGKAAHEAQFPGGDHERRVLLTLTEHMLIRANELALAQCEESIGMRGWWTELATEVRRRRLNCREDCIVAIDRYQADFQPQIEGTARQLLDGLKEHPTALNSLRAARFTTDAIALAMALHSGGIGLQDFVIAPAILAVTSLMAEGVLGRYMLKAEQDLKRQQFDTVEHLLRGAIVEGLTAMPLAVESDRRFNIPIDRLAAVERTWH